MKSIIRALSLIAVAVVLFGGVIWGFHSNRSDQTDDDTSHSAAQGPAAIATTNGVTVLTVSPAAQRANGIVITTVHAEKKQIEERANGVVLNLQPVLDLETSYSAALMNLAKARATVAASLSEYRRLEKLNHDGSNVSQRAVEMARAAFQSDAATEQDATRAMAVAKASIALHWGRALAHWVEQGSPDLNALLAQRKLLLQVTMVMPGNRPAPASANVELPDHRQVSAHLISALPQLDPRLQTPGYLYIVPARAGLTPGMNLSVSLAAGPRLSGVMVPSSAVVWWQGRAWCYVEVTPNKFTRREVSTGNPLPGGWFVIEGIAPGTQIVTEGAQTLLSTEFRPQMQMDED